MGIERAAQAGLTAAQAMDFWLWLWLGFAEREAALGKRSAAPGSSELAAALSVELAALEEVSSRLSAELPVPGPGSAEWRTFSRLQGGLPASATERIGGWLAEPAPPPGSPLRRRALEVLRQAQQAPPPSPARAAAIELWSWLTGAEADRRLLLAGAGRDRRLARQLSDELRLLQTVQQGVRRGQPDVIPSHRHEASWLGARQPFQQATAAELARVLRRAEAEVSSGRGGPPLARLVAAAASRFEAMAGPAALAAVVAREAAERKATPARARIAAGLIAAEGGGARHPVARFLGRPVAADGSRLGATLVDADLGDRVAWRAAITPQDFEEAAEYSAAGAVGYELYLLVDAGGRLEAVHPRIDRSPHGRRWFAPVPAPGWLHPQGRTLDLAWSDVAAPAQARMMALVSALTSGAIGAATPDRLPDRALAIAARRARRSRH